MSGHSGIRSSPSKSFHTWKLTELTTDCDSLPESNIAPYLTALQKRVNSEGVRVGSYPLFLKGVYVSLIGRDEKRVRELGEEVRYDCVFLI